jgi:hypothetical protein
MFMLPVISLMALVPVLSLAGGVQEPRSDPACSPDIRWAMTAPLPLARAPATSRTLTLFSAIAQGCETGEIRLTAAYFDSNDELVCSGVVASVARQGTPTQTTVIDLRALSLAEWVRWRNGPSAVALRPKALECVNAEGTGPIQPTELDRAASMRLYATILTRDRGLATAELRFLIQP